MRRTTCRLIRLISATDCKASHYKDLISVVLPKLNACSIRIRVNTTNNILFRIRGPAFPLEISKKGVISQIEMRGLAIM